jgi:hypothetical protein
VFFVFFVTNPDDQRRRANIDRIAIPKTKKPHRHRQGFP